MLVLLACDIFGLKFKPPQKFYILIIKKFPRLHRRFRGSLTLLLDTQKWRNPPRIWSRLVEITGGLSVNWADKQKERVRERETWRQLTEVNWRVVETRELILRERPSSRLLFRHDIKFSYFGLTRAVCQDHSIRRWHRPLSISPFILFHRVKEGERS